MRYRTKLTLAIYWEHIRRYRFFAVGTLLCVMLATAAGLMPPIFYRLFFNSLALSDGLPVSPAYLFRLLSFVIGSYVLGMICQRSAGFLANFWVSKVMKEISDTCFGYLHKHSFSFFNNNFVGSLVKRVNRFYYAFGTLHAIVMWEMVPLLTNVLVVTIVLFARGPVFGWILIGWMAAFGVLSYIISQVLLKYYVDRSQIDSRVTGYLADTITNHSNVKLFTGYEREKQGFSALGDIQQQARKRTWDLSTISEAAQALLMFALEFSIMYMAIRLWFRDLLTLGDFVLIQSYLLTIFHRFWNLGRHIRDIYEQLAEAEEMTEIFDTPHEVVDRHDAKPLMVEKGAIDFEHVTFHYHQTRKVIDDLNFTIHPGERIALVGPSGAGKSTIVRLLLRMHDVTSGKILIDGQRISHVTQDSLHAATSLVPQDPVLFHRSLFDNIAYGRPGATREEILEASRLAHCHEFISEFPDGYETYVGERGVKLSGGERQRVAIARAILRNATILILDEATSSLDSESERLIQDALRVLMQGKTVIVIAHRLSTIMQMNRIVVIEGGRIVEEGTHEALVRKRNGLYHRLWKYQAGGFIA